MFQAAYDRYHDSKEQVESFDSSRRSRDGQFASILIGEIGTDCPMCLTIKDCIEISGRQTEHVALTIETSKMSTSRLGQY